MYGFRNQTRPLKQKPTTEEIRTRFDPNVERFSNLETGQAASIDVPLAMELISFNREDSVGARCRLRRGQQHDWARQRFAKDFDADPLDLRQPMLDRVVERLPAI